MKHQEKQDDAFGFEHDLHFLVLLVFLFYSKLQGEKVFETKPGGILYSTLAGTAIGFAFFIGIAMFDNNPRVLPLSQSTEYI